MTGRGIDQILPFPSSPDIYEPYVTDAGDYVELAERAHGAIPRPADFSYIWGDALDVFARAQPDMTIFNLETSITRCLTPWPGKEIQYKMNPANLRCLTVTPVDCCALANNHVADWGFAGLEETLESLRRVGIGYCGAGTNADAAWGPFIKVLDGGTKIVVFSFGSSTSGVPDEWAATPLRSGVALLPDLSRTTVGRITKLVERAKHENDIVVVSLHWGGNWGYAIPDEFRAFGHDLIDLAHVDIVHGHSSHHPRPFEVYNGKLILYGCGDFVNDYEGISGYERYRDDLALLYIPRVEPSDGHLIELEMRSFQMRRFRLKNATPADVEWVRLTLNRTGEQFGVEVVSDEGGGLLARP